jgi:hypothetical protein
MMTSYKYSYRKEHVKKWLSIEHAKFHQEWKTFGISKQLNLVFDLQCRGEKLSSKFDAKN